MLSCQGDTGSALRRESRVPLGFCEECVFPDAVVWKPGSWLHVICPSPIGNPPSLWHTFLKANGGHTLILTLWSTEALSGESETFFFHLGAPQK